jgi:hypothetical protein
MKNTVLNASFDLLDLLKSLFLVETIKKEVDIASRCEVLVIVLPQSSLTASPLLRNRQESGSDGASSSNDIIPIEVGER